METNKISLQSALLNHGNPESLESELAKHPQNYWWGFSSQSSFRVSHLSFSTSKVFSAGNQVFLFFSTSTFCTSSLTRRISFTPNLTLKEKLLHFFLQWIILSLLLTRVHTQNIWKILRKKHSLGNSLTFCLGLSKVLHFIKCGCAKNIQQIYVILLIGLDSRKELKIVPLESDFGHFVYQYLWIYWYSFIWNLYIIYLIDIWNLIF